jgi:hypothetical protein
MFCPQCKAEYRKGFTKCSDCDVDLVWDGPAEPLTHENEELRMLYQTSNQAECVAVCRELQSANIFYRVAQEVLSRGAGTKISWRYGIGVRRSEFDRAKDLLGIEAETGNSPCRIEDDDEEGCGDPSVELPDLAPSVDFAGEERSRIRAYLKQWYPEDATVRIWQRNSEDDYSSGVERALTENLIHFRSVSDGKEVRELFVLPEDESRARRIVREIEEGLPLE